MKHVLLTLGFVALAGSATAQEFSFRFQSSDQPGSAGFTMQQQWTEMVGEATGGRVAIELLPTGSVVAYSETQDAVAEGAIDGHITDSSYFAGKDPAFGLIANPVGAWSDPAEMLSFMREGGGAELMNELLEPLGLRFLGATTPGLEAFVSSVPLGGVDDLQGLTMRAPEGLVGQVFTAAGADVRVMPFSDVAAALERGEIEAADASVFFHNQAEGMHNVAKHPVFPGFHSMPLVEVSMNLSKWNALPEDLQRALEESVVAFADIQVATLSEADLIALVEAEAGGATVHNWSAAERARFRSIALDEWAKVAERSENARLVFERLSGYLRDRGMLAE